MLVENSKQKRGFAWRMFVYFGAVRCSIIICALFLAACQRLSDRTLVGKWEAGCDAGLCAHTTLNADHTFLVNFDQKGFATSYTGTWRVEKDQLIGHVTSASEGLEDLIGKDLRVKVSDFRHDQFTATIVEDGSTNSGIWKRTR